MSKLFIVRVHYVLTIAIHLPIYPFSQIIKRFSVQTNPYDYESHLHPEKLKRFHEWFLSQIFIFHEFSKTLTTLSLNIWRCSFAAGLKRNAVVGTTIRDTASCVSYVALLLFPFWGVSVVLCKDFNSISKRLMSQKPLVAMSHMVKLMPHINCGLVLNLSL